MSTEVDGKPADPPLNGSASSYSGVSPLRSLRQMFPKTLSDKYRLGEELGRGAYGHVFRGLDTRTGQHVAIKQIGLERIPPGGLAGIIREVDLLKTLHHPNVVKYLGSLRTSTHLYIVLEFVENGALSSIIKSSSFGPFPESLVAIYVQQVLQGLAYLHTQGVVHRDIKGANILTTKEGIVKLADFGVAAQLSDLDASRPAGASLRSSGSSSPVGTAYWMAPEVVEMGGVTTAADIWSVGCLAVELFTGVPPYYDLQPMSALYNIVADPHPPLPKNISAAMRDFLLRCFAKDPKKRPSAAELLEHAWLTYNRRTLRGTWSRTRGTRSTHTSVALVVERMLAADAAEGGTVKGTEESTSSRDSTAPPMAIKEASVAAEGSSSAQLEKRSSAIKDEPTTTSASSLVVSLDFADEDLTGLHLLEHLRSQGTALALSPRTLHIDDELAEAQHTELLRAVAKQVSALQVVRFGAQRDVVKEAGAAASCAALASLLRGDDADRVRLVARSFVAQQGLPALRDLLDASSERLLDRAMDLVLCLLGPGPAGDACLSPALAAGLIPAVLRFARPVHPHALRVVAAHIAEALSRTAQGTSTLLSADQLPALLDLLLGDGQSHGSSNNNVTTAPLSLDLLQAALDCCWRLVLRAAADAPGMPSVNEIFRALARAGLAERMTAVLPAVLQAYRARASAGPVAGGLGMVRAAHARSASVPLTETELALLVPTSSGADARGGAVPGHPQPSSSMNIAAQTSSTNGAETTTPMHLHGAIIPPPPLPNKLTVVGHGRPSTGATQAAIDETPSSSPRGHTASHFGSRSSATTMGDMSSSVHHHGGLPQGPRSPIRRLPPGRVVSQGTEPESSDVLLQSTLSYPSGARTAAEQHHANSSSPLPLLDGILNLYASMVYGDALVKAALVTRPVLGPLFSITAALPAPLALTVVGAVRALTADRDMHEALTNASGIAFLVAQLARPNEPLLQDQALSALHSLTADDLARQEQAAVAGTVPFLCQLGILPQRGAVAAHAHALAVSLLCALARGSARSRAELWAHDALSVFLHLLKDETCQVEVLGALASWLEADTTRVENRLATGDALTRIVTLIPVMSATAGENEALCGVLAPLHHLLSVSPRLARELASNGLMPRVLELLRRRTAITTVPALDVLAAMVGAHPQPKALAARFRLVPLLLPLAQSQVTDGVQRKATVLLQTLREG